MNSTLPQDIKKISLSVTNSIKYSIKKVQNSSQDGSSSINKYNKIIQNTSQSTFESSQPLRSSQPLGQSFEQYAPFSTEIKLMKQSLSRWSQQKYDLANQKNIERLNHRQRKYSSVNNCPSAQMTSLKAKSTKINSKFSQLLSKRMKFSNIKRNLSPKPIDSSFSSSINNIMIKKFNPIRQYENSKTFLYKILPSFLKFSISQAQNSYKHLIEKVEQNTFKQRKLYHENKYIYL